jgi:Protein of unknown function (DUF2934)
MSTETEDRIRERAHQIWEREGRPSGREAVHWDQAARDIEAEEKVAGAAGGSSGTPRGFGDDEALSDVQSAGVDGLSAEADRSRS